MENFRLPAAVVFAMIVQIAGGVWWVSQQAATIASLESDINEFASKMAVEDSVNLKRDVVDNSLAINRAFDDIDEIWDELDSQSMSIMRIVDLQQRVALLERTLEFITRDHSSMLDSKGGME